LERKHWKGGHLTQNCHPKDLNEYETSKGRYTETEEISVRFADYCDSSADILLIYYYHQFITITINSII